MACLVNELEKIVGNTCPVVIVPRLQIAGLYPRSSNSLLYPYFFCHPGHIHQPSDVCELHIHEHILDFATENFHVGWKVEWQYIENYSDSINSGTTSDWMIYCYDQDNR